MLIEGQGDTEVLVEDLGDTNVSIEDTNEKQDVEISIDLLDDTNEISLKSEIVEETTWFKVKSLLLLAAPLMCSIGSDLLVSSIQLMFIGHLGANELAAAALGSSFYKVTGLCVIIGLLSAVDTLVSQSYGAKKYKQVGEACNMGLIVVISTSIVILPLYLFSGRILLWLHQDPDVAELAALYIQVSWLQVIPFGIVSILRKFLQNQNIVNPLIISGFINIVLTTISIIIMLYVFEWGFVSLPLNMLFCNILSITYLSIVILYKKLWQKTYSPFTWNTFKGLPEFYKLAIPGMLMGCAEWWSYETIEDEEPIEI